MQVPTLAPSPFGIHRSRVQKIVGLVFVVGVALFGYGLAATALGLVPAGWGVVAVFQYVVMAVGALLASLMGLVTVWFSRQERPRPLPRSRMLVTGLLAPPVSTGALVVAHWWRVGEISVRLQFLDWLLLGGAVLGLQLFVGSLEPARRRRRVLLAEVVLVPALVFSFLAVDRGALDLASLASYLFVSVGAAGLFLLVGGALYLLGNLLVCRPSYHRIP